MTNLVIRNARPWGGPQRDLHIFGGRYVEAPSRTESQAPAGPGPAATVIDARGMLALPGLTNAHAHVDKSWCGKPWQSYGGEGTTAGRIAHERAHRAELGIPGPDVTRETLRAMIASGTTAIRSHVDVDLGIGTSGLDIVTDTLRELAPELRYQLVAFPQDGVVRRPGVATLLRQAAKAGVAHIGGLDPAGIDRDPVGQLNLLFDIAGEYGCGIDIHLHDPAELGAFQLELIIERTHALGMAGKVNIAHGFCISQLSPARQERLLDDLAAARISYSTVAPIGHSRLPAFEMRARGIRVGLGTDGFRDLWSPYGTGDMMQIATQHARLTGHLHDGDLVRVLRQATAGGLVFVGEDDSLDEDALKQAPLESLLASYRQADFAAGKRADLMLVEAENPMDALVRAPRRRYVILAGTVVARDGQLVA